MIFGDKHISASEMAGIIGITERAVEKQLAKLKEKGIIDRAGSDKGRYWKINYDPYSYRLYKMKGGTFKNYKDKTYLPLTETLV